MKRILFLFLFFFFLTICPSKSEEMRIFIPPMTPACGTVELFKEWERIFNSCDKQAEADFTMENYPEVFMVYEKRYVKLVKIVDGIAVTETIEEGRRICTWASKVRTEVIDET